jgi:hypothetical protein
MRFNQRSIVSEERFILNGNIVCYYNIIPKGMGKIYGYTGPGMRNFGSEKKVFAPLF